MPSLALYEDPEQWRDRTDEARTTAAYAADPVVTAAMLRIAEEYARLVLHTQDKQKSPDDDRAAS